MGRSYASSSRTIPPGVHEANPSVGAACGLADGFTSTAALPNHIAAKLAYVTPSTSFAGGIASKAARSSMCGGLGCCSRMPWTVGSSPSRVISAINASVVVSAGSSILSDRIPTASHRLRFIRV